MSFTNLILEVLENYGRETQNEFTNNPLAQLIRDAPQTIAAGSAGLRPYTVKGSAGLGQWTPFPWIAFLDEDVSSSVQNGYCVFLLFSKDYKRCYLSLNQGYTYFKELYSSSKIAYRLLSMCTNFWQQNLSVPDGFSTRRINLAADASDDNAIGYQAGNIFSKTYTRETMPGEFEFLNDLHIILNTFTKLKSFLIDTDYALTNQAIISGSIETIYEDSLNYSLQQTQTPRNLSLKQNIETLATEKTKLKTNRQQFLNHFGEIIVYIHEKEKLQKLNANANVEHIPQNKSIALGYNILSYNEHNEPKYINVKTTTSGEETPFFLTPAEKDCARKYGKIYYLYRLYDIKKDHAKYYVLRGPLEKSAHLAPIQYIGLPK